ncbi:MAG: hypothetical protein ACRBM6_26455, partial [Geminicoccales bacterium]
MFGAILGAVGKSVLGGVAKKAAGSFLGKLGGGLSGMISKLFGGGGGKHAGGPDQAKALLGDIKNLLTQLLNKMDQKGGDHKPGHCGGGHGNGGAH